MYQPIYNFTASSRLRANPSLEMRPSSPSKFSPKCTNEWIALTFPAKAGKSRQKPRLQLILMLHNGLRGVSAASAWICLGILLDQYENINQAGSYMLGCKSHCVRRLDRCYTRGGDHSQIDQVYRNDALAAQCWPRQPVFW
jgi:hypothetical protein